MPGRPRPLWLAMLLAVAMVVLLWPVLGPHPSLDLVGIGIYLWGVYGAVPFLAVGCLLLLRAGWHRMGWLLAATGVALAVALVGLPGVPPEYFDLTAPWTTVFALFAYITLVFPTGRQDSWTGWRATVVRWVAGALVVFALAELTILILTALRGEPPGDPSSTRYSGSATRRRWRSCWVGRCPWCSASGAASASDGRSWPGWWQRSPWSWPH